jgi:hypothetical protein
VTGVAQALTASPSQTVNVDLARSASIARGDEVAEADVLLADRARAGAVDALDAGDPRDRPSSRTVGDDRLADDLERPIGRGRVRRLVLRRRGGRAPAVEDPIRRDQDHARADGVGRVGDVACRPDERVPGASAIGQQAVEGVPDRRVHDRVGRVLLHVRGGGRAVGDVQLGAGRPEHRVARLGEHVDEVRADEPARAGDQDRAHRAGPSARASSA